MSRRCPTIGGSARQSIGNLSDLTRSTNPAQGAKRDPGGPVRS